MRIITRMLKAGGGKGIKLGQLTMNRKLLMNKNQERGENVCHSHRTMNEVGFHG